MVRSGVCDHVAIKRSKWEVMWQDTKCLIAQGIMTVDGHIRHSTWCSLIHLRIIF